MAETRMTVEVPAWFVEPTFAGRFLAAVVDGLLFFVVGILAARLTGDLRSARWYSLAIAAIYVIGAVALTGRTVGKLLFGLRVADLATGAVPDLRAAAVRWLVPAVPGLVASVLSGPVAGVLSLAPIAIYWGVLLGPLHRGLHDRAAGTVVTARAVEV